MYHRFFLVQCRKFDGHFLQALPHLGRGGDFDLSAKAADPAIELVADADGDIEVEIALFIGQEHGRRAEALPHGAVQIGRAAQGDTVLRAAVHVEVAAQVGGQVEIRKLLPAPAGHIQHPDATHLIHPVMADAFSLRISDKVVAPVLPGQLPRADDPFLWAARLFIVELHHSAVVDGLVQGIDAVQQALAVGLGAALHIDLTLQLASLIIGAKLFQLADQPLACGTGHHPAGLDSVYQQLELGQVKGTAGKEVAAAPAPAQLDIIAQSAQRLNVAVHALTLAADALRF